MNGQAKSWRRIRTSTPKQCQALDFLTNQGEYAATPLKNPMLLFGGEGYASKSYCIRTAAVEVLMEYRRLGFPNQEVAIFCSTMPNLKDRQIGKIKKEFRGFADIVGSQIEGPHVRFYGPGTEGLGIIKLRSVADATAASSKKGAEFSAIFVDELTEFTREQFGELLYMKRSGENIPFSPFMGATNPDGVGHPWVKKLWIPEFKDFEDEDPAIKALMPNFFFIHMKKEDNPGYVANKETVDAAIGGIQDPEIRRARRDGAWDIFLGGRFTNYSKSVHGYEWADFLNFYGYDCPPNYYEQRMESERIIKAGLNYGFEVYGSFDYGTAVDGASAFYLHAVCPSRYIWTFNPDGQECYMSGLNLVPQAKIMRPYVANWKPRTIYCDPALTGKPAESTDRLSRIDKFRQEGIRMRPGVTVTDRTEGWATLEYLLEYPYEQDKISGKRVITGYPKWRIHNNCMHVHTGLRDAPRNPIRKEDIDPKFQNDHALDSVKQLLHTRFRAAAKVVKQPERGSVQWLMAERRKRMMASAWD